MKKLLCASMCLCAFIPSIVNAENSSKVVTSLGDNSISQESSNVSFLNKSGVSITLIENEKLKNAGYDDEIIQMFTEKELNNTLNAIDNFQDFKIKTTYVRTDTTYNKNGEILETINTEITKEEYDNGETVIRPMSNYLQWETTYKRLVVSLAKPSFSQNRYWSQNILTWKKLPANWYTDIMASRFDNIEFYPNTSFTGGLVYYSNGTITSSLDVSPNGHSDLMVRLTNGVYYMLPIHNNSGVDQIKAYSEFYVKKKDTSKNGIVYTTYQHAQKNVSQDNIRKYFKFSSTGLGEVFTLGSGLDSNYDKMQGVYIDTNFTDIG